MDAFIGVSVEYYSGEGISVHPYLSNGESMNISSPSQFSYLLSQLSHASPKPGPSGLSSSALSSSTSPETVGQSSEDAEEKPKILRVDVNFHSRPQRLQSIWPAPWIEISGRLQFVLVTGWSDTNTIKSDKPEKKHEAWRKDTNKSNFCSNVRLQGKYYKQKPSVRFTWKAMKGGIGRALEIFSVIKISLAIVCHLESAELTKLQEFLKMVLRSKAQKESIIRSKRGNTVKESPLPPLHQVWEVRKKSARSAAWNLCYANFFH